MGFARQPSSPRIPRRPRSEAEILAARIIDRPLRPMLASGWTHETQVLVWLLSYDGEVRAPGCGVGCWGAETTLNDLTTG